MVTAAVEVGEVQEQLRFFRNTCMLEQPKKVKAVSIGCTCISSRKMSRAGVEPRTLMVGSFLSRVCCSRESTSATKELRINTTHVWKA